jgi:hypothetical protein
VNAVCTGLEWILLVLVACLACGCCQGKASFSAETCDCVDGEMERDVLYFDCCVHYDTVCVTALVTPSSAL